MKEVTLEAFVPSPPLTHPDDIVPGDDPRLSLLPDEIEAVKGIALRRVPSIVTILHQDMAFRLAELAPIPVEGDARAVWLRRLDAATHEVWINLTAERRLYRKLANSYETCDWKMLLFSLTGNPWEEEFPGYLPRAEYETLQAIRNAYQQRKDATLREVAGLFKRHQNSTDPSPSARDIADVLHSSSGP